MSRVTQVSWYQLARGRELEVAHDARHVYSMEGDIHKLTIQHLGHAEISNFTCRAENEVGYSKGHIEVTGKLSASGDGLVDNEAFQVSPSHQISSVTRRVYTWRGKFFPSLSFILSFLLQATSWCSLPSLLNPWNRSRSNSGARYETKKKLGLTIAIKIFGTMFGFRINQS